MWPSHPVPEEPALCETNSLVVACMKSTKRTDAGLASHLALSAPCT